MLHGVVHDDDGHELQGAAQNGVRGEYGAQEGVEYEALVGVNNGEVREWDEEQHGDREECGVLVGD